MRDFIKNIGYLFIIAGAVLLLFYTTLNRISNVHFIIAGTMEIGGLIVFILTNRFINDSDPFS